MRWAITAEAGASPWTPVSARLNAWTPVRGTVCHWLRHVHGLCHNNVNRITPRSSLVRRLPINRHLGDELSSLLSHNCTALFAMRDPFPQNEGRCHVDWWTPNKCFPLLFTAVKVKQGQLRFMSHNVSQLVRVSLVTMAVIICVIFTAYLYWESAYHNIDPQWQKEGLISMV